MCAMYMPDACRGQKRMLSLLEMELQMTVSCHEGSGNQIQLLCENSKCSFLIFDFKRILYTATVFTSFPPLPSQFLPCLPTTPPPINDLFFSFLRLIYFVCIGVLPAYISVCHIHAWCPARPREGIRSPGWNLSYRCLWLFSLFREKASKSVSDSFKRCVQSVWCLQPCYLQGWGGNKGQQQNSPGF